LTVVECPSCRSRFKIEKSALPKKTVKMRCSVCSHVFSYSVAEEGPLEQDFDSIIGTQDRHIEEDFSQASLAADLTEGISEGSESDEPSGKESIQGEIQPESVIKEIDSILGAGEEVAGESEQTMRRKTGKSPVFRVLVSVLLLVLIFAGIGLWIMKDSLPILRKSPGAMDQTFLERGPFFAIPEESITYEMFVNNNEGAVLVVKGIIRKLTSKPLKSVMVQARVYDRNNNLIESRNAYAGIIPESAELVRRKGSDIETLLSAEPETMGVLSTSPDIPFAVAFFGRPAREGFSFQVEVKEFHWK